MSSKKVKGITIEIDGNTTKLGEALKNAENNINRTNNELRNLNKALKLDPSNVQLLSQKHELLRKNIKEAKDKLEQLKEAQKQMGAYSKLTDEQKESYRALSAEISKTESSIKSLSRELDKTGAIRFDQLGESLKKAGNIALNVTKQMVKVVSGVSAALSAFVGYSIKVGSEFEASMSKVQAISGATGDDLEKLSEKAKEMGAKTKFSASESAEALQYMAMAGWKTNDMVDGLSGIMSLAAASGEDLALTSDIVTDALTAFGMKAEESSHFADILASASSNSNTNVAMMGETFKYVASIAGSLGYSAEDTALAIGLMANAGIKATQAGTSLRSIMSRIATDTNGARDAIESLGVKVINTDGSMRDFGDVISDLRPKFQKLTAEQQANYAKTIAGQNALSGFLAIVNSADTDFEKLSSAINNCNGTAEKMAEIMLDNLPGQITLLKSALEGLGNSMYENLQEPLKNIVSNIVGYVQELIDAFNNNGVIGLTQALGNVLASMISKIVEFAPKFIDMALLIVKNLAIGIQNNLPTIVNGAIEIVTNLLLGIGNMLPQILETGMELIVQLMLGIAQKAPDLVPQIVDIIIKMMETFNEHFDDFIKAGLQLIWGLIQGLINSIPNILENLPTIITAISNFFTLDKLLSAGITLLKGLGNGMIKAIPDLLKNIPKIISNLVNSFKTNGISAFKDIGTNLVKGLWNGISGSFDWIKNKIEGWVGNVIDFIKKLFGIHSPSTLMRDQIGINLTKGIGKGFEKGMPDTLRDVNRAMTELNSEVKSSINPVINPTANSNPLILNIENFNNSRNTDIQQLAEELEFYRKNSALAKGSE